VPGRAIRPWWRGIALGAATLVGLLVVLAASPGLHAALHADAAHADHACAVTLFVHGLDAPVADTLRPVAPLTWTEFLPPVAVETLRPTPRYWLPPHCGPPAG
jgi:hypothetical protein